jgi:heat shock protein HspQ
MELIIGDLVRHNVHGFYGIVVSKVDYYGRSKVCKVEWCNNRKNHIIDIRFLDKINNT